MSPAKVPASFGLFIALAAGCSSPEIACESSLECRDAFGFGSVCGEEGFCTFATLPPRCDVAVPNDLFDNPSNLDNVIVVASLIDRQFDFIEGQAVRLAFEQVREQVTLSGKTFGLLECTYEENPDIDGLDYPALMAELGPYLVDELGISALIGPQTSGTTTALYNAIERRGFIMSPAATSPALTFIDGGAKTDENPGSLWRTAPPDSLQGEVAALDMIARGTQKVGLVYANDAYGAGLAEIFQLSFAGGGRVIDVYSFSNESELSEAIGAVKIDNTIDEVFFIASEVVDAIAFINAAALGGFEVDPEGVVPPKRIFLPDAAAFTDLILGTSGASQLYPQIRGTRPSVDTTTLNYSTFATAYSNRWGVDPRASIYAAYAYDAAWVTLYASAWSEQREGGQSPVGLGRGMRKMSDKTTSRVVDIRPSAWSNLTGFFRDGLSVDVVGVSGSLDYDPDTEETTASIEVWEISGNDFIVVDTIEP